MKMQFQQSETLQVENKRSVNQSLNLFKIPKYWERFILTFVVLILFDF